MKVEPTLRCRRKADSTRNIQTHVRDAVVEVILFLDKLDGLLSAGPILNLGAFGIGGLGEGSDQSAGLSYRVNHQVVFEHLIRFLLYICSVLAGIPVLQRCSEACMGIVGLRCEAIKLVLNDACVLQSSHAETHIFEIGST